MKKLVVVAVMVATLVGCSKESELTLQESAKDQVALSSDGSFDVATVDANGLVTITYELADLADLCACAVSEDNAESLGITQYAGGTTFYLKGVGRSTGSFTTFAIELTQNGNVLSWVDNAEIKTCETTATEPCDLMVQSSDSFTCSNDIGTCGQNVIGGDDGASYADCEYPWLIGKKGGK